MSEPSVGLDEGVTVQCVCGWWGWVEPDPYDSPAKVERDCPDCERHITVTAELVISGNGAFEENDTDA